MNGNQPPGAPPPPPPGYTPRPPGYAPPPAPGAGSGNLDLGQVLNEAWELFTRDATAYVVATLIHLAIIIVTCGLGILVFGPLIAGLVIMGFKARKGEPISYNDALAGFKVFGPTFVVSLIMGIGVLLGMVLCVLPGIYLAIAWAFALPLVIDKKMEAWPAMQLSMQKVNENFVPVLIVVLVLGVINSLGSSVVLGLLVTQPLYVLGVNVAYEKLFGPLQPGPVVTA